MKNLAVMLLGAALKVEAIKTGDLVMIVRPAPCGCHKAAGLIFMVKAVRHVQRGYCATCKTACGPALCVSDDSELLTHISRLKRIPPLEELEDERRDGEITA